MGKILDILFKDQDSPIFRAANLGLKSIEHKLKNVNFSLEYQKWIEIYKGDKHSPKVMDLGNDQILIYYPKNSSPYYHDNDRKKYVTIIKGELFDLMDKSGDKLPDKFEVGIDDKVVPFTKDKECYLFVELEKTSIWDNICQ